jgi:hypothetical protein
MKKIGVRDLKNYLNQQSDKELILQIVELFRTFEQVKEFYQIRLNPDSDEDSVRKPYEEKIRKVFFPANPRFTEDFPRLSDARRAISDYKKIAISRVSIITLMLFYVEMGCKFTQTYGDLYESFYSSLDSMFDRAVKEIIKYDLQDEFEIYCHEIVNLADGTGWGFHDGLDYTFHQGFRKK